MAKSVTTAKGALGYLSRFFQSDDVPDDEKTKLWDVLSAFRGPDSEDLFDKEATTAVIRQRALGLKSAQSVPALFVKDSDRKAQHRRKMTTRFRNSKKTHFFFHVKKAFQSLDLSWDTNNEEVR